MSDLYAQLVNSPVGSLRGLEGGSAAPGAARPLSPRGAAHRRRRAARRCARRTPGGSARDGPGRCGRQDEHDARAAAARGGRGSGPRRRALQPRERRPGALQGPRVRRLRDRRLDRAHRAAALLLSGARRPAAQRARDRARHAAGAGRLEQGRHRPASARGLHPLARQGGRRTRRDRAARVSSPRAPRTSSPRRCASCSRRARPTSPARSSRSAPA